ncbi:MAG: DNA-binding response regulator [Bacteroidota bacterium]|nr:DNA-binding response regulator [Bacteroidota bacterium]
MINAVIVDDEKAGIENLKALLAKYCPQIKIKGEAENYNVAKKVIDEVKPQLVFLDIEMPFGNGFELLAAYEQVPFEVIFVTAFEKYALKAIRLSACDYILKPIEISELIAAVIKAAERITFKTEGHNLKFLLANVKAADKDRKIALPSLHGMIFVKMTDIIHCEADGGYTWFHFTNREKLLVTKNLGEYEDLLGEKDFVRVHHAHLINYNHIIEFKKGNAPIVIMSDGSPITVSQRKRDILLGYLNAPSG